MPITKFSRGNFLHGVGNRAVRNAINALGPHATTCYDLVGQTVNNSTVLVPETALVMDVVGNAAYWLQGILTISIAAAANNIKFDFNAGTALASNVGGNVQFSATGTATTLTINAAALNTSISGGTTTAWTSAEVNIFFFCTQSGTIQLEFAQVAATTNNTTISPGSFLTAVPLDHIVES